VHWSFPLRRGKVGKGWVPRSLLPTTSYL